jgi:hypothetical protein
VLSPSQYHAQQALESLGPANKVNKTVFKLKKRKKELDLSKLFTKCLNENLYQKLFEEIPFK